MFFTEFRRHTIEYLVLILGLAVICISFLSTWPDIEGQRKNVVALGIFYTGWGIWHHSREKSFRLTTVLEYVGLSLLACAILWFSLGY